eukprot:TRINITY_DN537_c0_g1_i4.p1 TRINITY_DN537_c0_g1~~TRINITY_DN537_c0_g1_i4.p1  ORF type:complete len:302 (+),score=48.65 TRINITY_DN537_c0_g1_i4:695-1600(+)
MEPKPFRLLVISTNNSNWIELFSDIKEVEWKGEKRPFICEQAHWKDINLTGYSDSGVVVDVHPQKDPFPDTNQNKHRTFKPDFILIRNVIRATPDADYQNLLYGFMHGGVPSVNSLDAEYAQLQRPIMYGALKSIQDKLGQDVFPLIPQYYYPSHNTMGVTPNYPLVLKVAHVHSGLGKVCLSKHSDFQDFTSVMALHNDYFTAEPFVNGEYDLRIQKIGDHVRVMKRTGTGQWKTNRGTAMLEDVQVNQKYKLWVDEASKLWGGLDICAVDVIHSEDGNEYILVNIDVHQNNMKEKKSHT